MRKQPSAAGTVGHDETAFDRVFLDYFYREPAPEIAAREAAKEAFDGLGASIVTFVHQHRSAKETRTD